MAFTWHFTGDTPNILSLIWIWKLFKTTVISLRDQWVNLLSLKKRPVKQDLCQATNEYLSSGGLLPLTIHDSTAIIWIITWIPCGVITHPCVNRYSSFTVKFMPVQLRTLVFNSMMVCVSTVYTLLGPGVHYIGHFSRCFESWCLIYWT